ncbi:glycoside hydrolase family 3 N-terminal domain-containing protein [Roseburia sp. AF20-18LB]|nr:glycoside hydrolase family 3 N-terminal domain-containing protein [Roseburia sp. AF20-18LB]
MHIASLSKELLQGLLRGKLGFNGMITTDATNMVDPFCYQRQTRTI